MGPRIQEDRENRPTDNDSNNHMKASNDTDSIKNKFSNELDGLKPGSGDDSAMLDE